MEMPRASGSPRWRPAILGLAAAGLLLAMPAAQAAPRAQPPGAIACAAPERVPARLDPGPAPAVEPAAVLMRAFYTCAPRPVARVRAVRGWVASGPLRRA